MMHLDMLGDVISKSGVDPCFHNAVGSDRFLCAKPPAVTYGGSVKGILLRNIEGEKKGIALYRSIIAKVPCDDVKVLLERIVMDEEIHLKVFSDLFGRYCRR